MSKKTLIIVLAIVVIGILVIVVAGRTSTQIDEPVTIDEDTFFNEDFDNEPMVEFDEEVMPNTETDETTVTEETVEEELTE